MKPGDRVRVTNPLHLHHGRIGMVVELAPRPVGWVTVCVVLDAHSPLVYAVVREEDLECLTEGEAT